MRIFGPLGLGLLGRGEVNLFPFKGTCWQSFLAEASSLGWGENLAIQGSDQSAIPGSKGHLRRRAGKKARACHRHRV